MTIYRHELKANRKAFLIWLICICGMCFGCILLYASVESSLSDMGDAFSNMGAMSVAFGMDRLSINTMTGYYATEIAMIHSLGGAMFAAMLGSNMLSKEEYGHTAEFLMTLPASRVKVTAQKALALVSYLVLFQALCTGVYVLGFRIMNEEIQWKHMLTLSAAQLLLFVEVAAIAFFVSAFSRKNMMGIGLGITLIFFSLDLMCRLIPAIEDAKYVIPFYYANAADIFTETDIPALCFCMAAAVTVVGFLGAGVRYYKKDIMV